MAWEGRLQRDDLGPGVWILVTDGGERIALAGDIPEELAGCRVAVEGRRSAGLGFGMTGDPLVEVSRVSPR
jgi:hypothetical protein